MDKLHIICLQDEEELLALDRLEKTTVQDSAPTDDMDEFEDS